jgi:hypothetical protein
MRFAYGVTFTRLRAPKVDDGYGGLRPNWGGNVTQVAYPGCAVAPRMQDGEERDRGRQGVVIGWTVYIPQVGIDVRFDDRGQIPQGTFEVEGDPAPYLSPYTGLEHGTVVQLKRVDG